MDQRMCNYFYPNQTFTLFPNQTINETLNVLFIDWVPYVKKIDEEVNGKVVRHKICGPLMSLMREFMIKARVNFRIIPASDDFQMQLMEEVVFGRTDVVVFPVPPNRLTSMLESTKSFVLSETIGQISLGHIASVTKPGERSEFMYLLSFEPEVWIALIITLIFIGLVMSVMRGNIKTFFDTIWEFSTVLLSDYMTVVYHKLHENIIVCIWLLVAGVVIFCSFTGCIWGFMIQKPPIQKIESWNDLHYKWKDKKIISCEYGLFADFATNDKSEMAQDFINRIEIAPPDSYTDHRFMERSMKKLISGKYVFVFEYHALRYLGVVSTSIREFKRRKGSKYGVDYHVSRSGGGTVPYFLVVKDKINLTRNLKTTISRLRESGIYEHWMEECLNRNEIGGDTAAKEAEEEVIEGVVEEEAEEVIEPLTLNNLSGVFKILIYGLTLSIIVFILEWIHYLFCNALLLKVNAIIQSSRELMTHLFSRRAHRIDPYLKVLSN